jgi:GntR family transcriptional regulator, transcriptional repressor for pyruvate dehydrogenase complex
MGRRTGSAPARAATSIISPAKPAGETVRGSRQRANVSHSATDSTSNNHRMWLESPRLDKLSERLARSILSDIVVGKMQVGAMLPSEAVMMESYGVGRNSVREALRILEIHGLVKIKPGPRGGPVVAQVSSGDLARSVSLFFHALGATFGDLLNARLIIEPLMARLATERITPESAEALSASLTRHDEAGKHEEEWMPASAGFHVIVSGLSGNPVLDLMSQALIQIYVERTPFQFPADQSEEVRRVHHRIAKAIVAGDSDLAESRMRRHIESQVTRVKRSRPELLDELIDWQ